jgi:hypothetical protein
LDIKDSGKKLARTLKVVTENEDQQFYALVAEGASIEKLPNDLYSIDDHSYYISFEGKVSPIIRNAPDGSAELILPVKMIGKSGEITYSIVW